MTETLTNALILTNLKIIQIMVKKSEMKTYKIKNRPFGDYVFSNDWHTLCTFCDGKWVMTPDAIMAKETIRVVDTVLANWWNNKVITLSKDDEKYLKNAIKIGKLKKATKKQIENDFYITVNVIDRVA